MPKKPDKKVNIRVQFIQDEMLVKRGLLSASTGYVAFDFSTKRDGRNYSGWAVDSPEKARGLADSWNAIAEALENEAKAGEKNESPSS
jgi:hypothetical protein